MLGYFRKVWNVARKPATQLSLGFLTMGGFIVDGGNFDWAASDKFPTMTEPYPGYPGMTYAEHFGQAAFIARAMPSGSRACAIPVFSNTPSTPNSIAIVTSLAVPTPASMMTG